MTTRAKHGIHKPKGYPPKFQMFFVTKPTYIIKPNSIQEAMATPHWLSSMEEEIGALKSNHTWDLVPFSASYNLVGNKWVFKVSVMQMGACKGAKHG